MTASRSLPDRVARWVAGRPGSLGFAHLLLAVSVTALGYGARKQHMATFEPVGHQSDFGGTVAAIEEVVRCKCALWAGDDFHNGYHGPLFYRLAAWLHDAWPDDKVKHVAALSVGSFVARQVVLCVGLRLVAPRAPWAMVLAAALHAALPVAVYQDGIAYNESLHATLFTAAFFALWRIEQRGPRDVSSGDAVAFGVFAGLGALTKATSALLPPIAAALAGWWMLRDRCPRDVARRLAVPGAAAALSWLMIAGGWCGRNLVAFHAPFPHQYDARIDAVAADHPSVLEPFWEARPLGWYLPLDARFFWSPFAPWSRHNFWGEMIAGTWADDINHGFCRLTERAWSSEVSDRPMSDRCVELGVRLTQVGTVVTALSVAGVAWLAWRFARHQGREGSLVVPLVVSLTAATLVVFGARYPFDHHPVIKASYALHLAPVLCASFGLFVAGESPAVEASARAWRAARIGAALVVIGWIGWAVRAEVFGS